MGPLGEYASSAMARERIFTFFSRRNETPMAILRLNYAIDLRYGVLMDIASRVKSETPIDLSMGAVNVIWQGDANSICLRSFAHCETPPFVLNLTGPETLSVRWIANQFAIRFQQAPVFVGEESEDALLNNASLCQSLFGYPSVSVHQMIDWIAHWLTIGGSVLGKPTKFQVRDGKF
jgi:nucleoside-diphosphate-sugar epimerase